MERQILSRSSGLNNIPEKKFNMILSELENLLKSNPNKLMQISALKSSFIRYYDSNIPIEYWRKSIERDFVGNDKLKLEYNEYVSDIKNSFIIGKSICFAGPHGIGKQLCLDTDIPTVNGFVKLRDLKEGDQLFDEKGQICNVLRLHPIQVSPESYRVFFDDGSTIDACSDHRWLTYTKENRDNNSEPTVKTTKEILNSLKFDDDIGLSANHSIQCCEPVQYNQKDLSIDPYDFGCWLGDKDSKIELFRDKYIPEKYLQGSYSQRLELVQGLMDTNGVLLKRGVIGFISTNKKLVGGVNELLHSLGIKSSIKEDISIFNGNDSKNRYKITFSSNLPIYKLNKDLRRLELSDNQLYSYNHRYILDIKKINNKPMRCITVDSDSHLFLASKNYIPTHNTMISCNILKRAVEKGYDCLYTTLSDVVHILTTSNKSDLYIARKELLEIDFLFIDEYDSRFISSDNASNLFAKTLESIFRTRKQNKMPTLFATNSPNVLNSFNGALKESLSSIMSSVKTVTVMDKDFRKEI